MICELCKKSLPQDGDCALCGKCGSELHFHCAGIQKSTWKAKSSKKRAEWECVTCRPSSAKSRTGSVDTEDDDPENDDPTYQALKKLLEKMFKKQEERIIHRVNSITAMVERVEESVNKIHDKVYEVEKNYLELKKEIEELKFGLESEKQYGRSKNFIVTSIPQSDKEDVPEKISKLVQKMNINLRKEDITAHRLPSPKSPAPIIVQCTTRMMRDHIVRTARKTRPTTTLINENQPERAIFFNDHLTPYFSNLMKKAKEIRNTKGFKFIWMNGNKILMKKDIVSKVIKITKPEDFDNIK